MAHLQDLAARQLAVLLDVALSHAPGRYSRYIKAIDQLLATAPAPIRNWTPRDMDTALYWLNHPTNTTAST
ncbi:hypothetical protein [[Kitasatospora] papulosa]|uniref:STAS/SEC14 domain-containing protein n=1 Tax=[Kitasatospora] papulosa TaxID=1464011 RepID=A0ABZ1KFW5_9ACTN